MDTNNTPTQAAHITALFGGEAKLAQALGIAPSTVYRWNYPRSRGGSDGIIPSSRLRDVLEAAGKLGIVIKPSDLYPTSGGGR